MDLSNFFYFLNPTYQLKVLFLEVKVFKDDEDVTVFINSVIAPKGAFQQNVVHAFYLMVINSVSKDHLTPQVFGNSFPNLFKLLSQDRGFVTVYHFTIDDLDYLISII